MSMEGWWMVTITVRPLRDTFLMLCITIAAARASSPVQQMQSSQSLVPVYPWADFCSL